MVKTIELDCPPGQPRLGDLIEGLGTIVRSRMNSGKRYVQH